MSAAVEKVGSEWIKLAHAERLADLPPGSVAKLVKLGHLTVRQLPGQHPRVRRSEVLKLAESSVHPAAVTV